MIYLNSSKQKGLYLPCKPFALHYQSNTITVILYIYFARIYIILIITITKN